MTWNRGDWKLFGGYIPLEMNEFIQLQLLSKGLTKSMYLRIIIQHEMKKNGNKEAIKTIASNIVKDWYVYKVKKNHQTLIEFLVDKNNS